MDDVIGQRAWNKLAHGRQCTGTSKQSGERCKRAPIVGGFVCDMHGGAIPAVRRSARERLLAMVDPALEYLLGMFVSRPPCETCGRSDADRDPVVLRACQLVLDRSGFGPSASLRIQIPEPKAHGYADWLTHDELMTLQTAMEAAKARMEAGEPPRSLDKPLPVVVVEVDEGVVIFDEDDDPIQDAEVLIPLGISTPEKVNDGND